MRSKPKTLHDSGATPLRSYLTANGGAVVVPRSLVRTKEISRHVVVIESRSDITISATIEDRTATEGGAVATNLRRVAPVTETLKKDRLLDEVRGRSQKAYEVAAELIAALEVAAFDSRSTATELQFGFVFPAEGGELLPIVSLTVTGVWPYLRTKTIGSIGDVAFADFKRRLHAIAPFYAAEEIVLPRKQWGHSQRYETLNGKTDEIVDALSEARAVAIEALTRAGAAL